jgi:hypothetical protein
MTSVINYLLQSDQHIDVAFGGMNQLKEIGARSLRGGGGELSQLKTLTYGVHLDCTKYKLEHII